MRQVLLKKGHATVDDVPAPITGQNEVLVQVHYSCISTGTELSGLRNTSNTLAKSALRNPRRILKLLDRIRNHGLRNTVSYVRNCQALEEAGVRTGYSASGVVLEVGPAVTDVKPGDRVACAGAGIADHAEFIAVPRTLLVPLPEQMSLALASTVTLGAIALQGVRRAEPQLGDNVAVIGLGILGQITTQLLKASGCRVFGTDLDPARVRLATSLGMDRGQCPSDQLIDDAKRFTGGHGVDSAIVCASSPSSQIVNQAMAICRRKGKVVIVGAVGLELQRADFYAKELDVRMSTSYGPGRYDDQYELHGKDYPYGYVRWTENRNMEAYLRQIQDGSIRIEPLIDRICSIDDAAQAFDPLGTARDRPPMVLLEYHKQPPLRRKIVVSERSVAGGRLNVAVIGAGTFMRNVHLPNLAKLARSYQIHAIVDKDGTNAKAMATRYGAIYAATDWGEVIQDDAVDLVMVGTRHNLHAAIAIEAARAGKGVLVEKPMAVNRKELAALTDVLEETAAPFMVGFNRRFSPCVERARKILDHRQGPMMVNYQMNAGFLPPDHWVHGPEGGGRNIGEACHVYDLFTCLTGSRMEEVSTSAISPSNGRHRRNDNFTASVRFDDGSVCNLFYTALGHPSVPKERMDIYCDGKVIQMDDYRQLTAFGTDAAGFSAADAEKGHYEELQAFAAALREGDGRPIPLWEMIQATEVSFDVEAQLHGRDAPE